EKLNFLPDLIEQQVRVSLVVTSVENCSGSELDLVYSVFTTQIAPVLSRTFESYQSGNSRRNEPPVPTWEQIAGAFLRWLLMTSRSCSPVARAWNIALPIRCRAIFPLTP